MKLKTWTLRVFINLSFLNLFACASGVFQYKEVEKLETNKEYNKIIKVKKIKSEKPPKAELKPIKESKKKTAKKEKRSKSQKMEKELEVKGAKLGKKEPSLEGAEGFRGRRPVKDPFGINEKIILNVKYFTVSAGKLIFECKNLVEVNGQRSYHFTISAKTNSFFSKIYKVENWVETYVDYKKLIPYSLAIHVKESKKLKESRSIYNFNTGKATLWEKKVTKGKGEKNRKLTWDIHPFSQNIVSAAFYLRTFTLRKGKKVAFHVANAGKNILLKAEVIHEERLKTDNFEVDTWVLKLEAEKEDGTSKKTGDIFIWLTKDERKFLVHMESKLKFGTLVGSLKEIHPGRAP